jgi:histone chaperone ASF1
MDCSTPGQMRFLFEAPPPNPQNMPEQDIVGVTAVLLTCSYKSDQEFLRVGYYVNIEYDSPELIESPPAKPDINKLTRHILAEKPRVTKFQIDWDNESEQMMMMQNSEEGLLQKGT